MGDAKSSRGRGRAVARLGLLGVGVGLGKLVAPRAVARLLGAPSGALTTGLLRGLGARDVVVGAGLLASRRSTPWLWARVGGGVVDLALLGAALRGPRARRGPLAGALAVAAGVTALDVLAAVASTRDGRARHAAPVRRAVTIARTRDDVYRFWRNFENAPAFMGDIESVELIDARRSRWSARGPVGPVVSWEAVLVEDRPRELLRWCSVEGAAHDGVAAPSDVRVDAVVRFATAPGGRGTEVRLELDYGPPEEPGGRVAAFLWKAGQAEQIEADLRRCKQLLETGHVVHSHAGPPAEAVGPGAASPSGQEAPS